jgi:Flp pilus assembly protein TadD
MEDVTDTRVYDLYTAGRAHLAAGEWLRAIPPLEEARDLAPDKGSIREALGVAYLRARRHADAEREIAVAVDLAPNDHYAYYLLGRAQQGLGRISLARGSYKMAVWLRPNSEDYRQALRDLPAA